MITICSLPLPFGSSIHTVACKINTKRVLHRPWSTMVDHGRPWSTVGVRRRPLGVSLNCSGGQVGSWVAVPPVPGLGLVRVLGWLAPAGCGWVLPRGRLVGGCLGWPLGPSWHGPCAGWSPWCGGCCGSPGLGGRVRGDTAGLQYRHLPWLGRLRLPGLTPKQAVPA